MNCQSIIERAFRRLGIIASGETPREQELKDAFDTLRAIYRRLITEGTLGQIIDVQVSIGETIYAVPNSRVIGSLATITLPVPAPDRSVIILVDPTTLDADEYLFDARIQYWQSIDDLTLTSPAPFGQRDANGLSSYLAVEIADEYGQRPSDVTIRNASRWQYSLSHHWDVENAPTKGVYF